ncbi:MAG: DUF6677 family protein [Planctomycetota bacterium]|jgi:hypothetical protein
MSPKDSRIVLLLTVGLAGWLVPGGGHFIIKERARAIIIFTAIVLTFAIGLYLGSVAVVNPVTGKLAYTAQIMNSPAVAIIGRITQANQYVVFGKPNEIGQIYTSIAGLLNLLCIVNAVYLAHVKSTNPDGA